MDKRRGGVKDAVKDGVRVIEEGGEEIERKGCGGLREGEGEENALKVW
ncbi:MULTISPECIES: hypothetical protein [unclassified Bartonella]